MRSSMQRKWCLWRISAVVFHLILVLNVVAQEPTNQNHQVSMDILRLIPTHFTKGNTPVLPSLQAGISYRYIGSGPHQFGGSIQYGNREYNTPLAPVIEKIRSNWKEVWLTYGYQVLKPMNNQRLNIVLLGSGGWVAFSRYNESSGGVVASYSETRIDFSGFFFDLTPEVQIQIRENLLIALNTKIRGGFASIHTSEYSWSATPNDDGTVGNSFKSDEQANRFTGQFIPASISIGYRF